MAELHMCDATIPPRRRISEVLALMPKNSTATMDADFARDVQAAIDSHRESLTPPAGLGGCRNDQD
jgi:hypothetical protein